MPKATLQGGMSFLQSGSVANRVSGPPIFQRWQESPRDELGECESAFRRWSKFLEECEENFRSHVYENPDASQLDFRQHRTALFLALYLGEDLALNFLALQNQESAEPYLKLIEMKKEALFKTLLDWHLPPDFVDSVPESFKEGMRAIAEGKVADFPGGGK